MCNNSNEVCVADILFNDNIFINKTIGELYKECHFRDGCILKKPQKSINLNVKWLISLGTISFGFGISILVILPVKKFKKLNF